MRTVHRALFDAATPSSPSQKVAGSSNEVSTSNVEHTTFIPTSLREELSWFNFDCIADLLGFFSKELTRASRMDLTPDQAKDSVRLVRNLLLESNSLIDCDKLYAGLKSLKRRDNTPVKPGTRYSTLLSLKKLACYLLQERAFLPAHRDLLNTLISRISEWQPKIAKQRSQRRTELWKKDSQNLAELDFSLAWREDLYANYLQLLQDPSSTLSDHLQCRAFILLRIVSENPSRSGAILNITVPDILKVPTPRTEDSHVDLVISKHKTDATSCAYITCSVELFRLLRLFATIRQKWTKDDGSDQILFVSQSGVPMQSSNLITTVNSLYHKLGGRGHMTPTFSRKRTARLAAAENSGMTQNMAATGMNHSISTHRRFYAGERPSEEETRRASSKVHSFLKEHSTYRVNTDTTTSDRSKLSSDSPPSSPNSEKRRTEYTSAQNRALKTAFKEGLQSGNTISISDIKEKLESDENLKALLSTRSPRQIYDKLRHMND